MPATDELAERLQDFTQEVACCLLVEVDVVNRLGVIMLRMVMAYFDFKRSKWRVDEMVNNLDNAFVDGSVSNNSELKRFISLIVHAGYSQERATLNNSNERQILIKS